MIAWWWVPIGTVIGILAGSFCILATQYAHSSNDAEAKVCINCGHTAKYHWSDVADVVRTDSYCSQCDCPHYEASS